MERVHPEFGPDAMKAYDADNIDRAADVMLDGIWYWVQTIIAEIGEQNKSEIPFIIAALKSIVAAYDKLSPGAEELADSLAEMLTENE